MDKHIYETKLNRIDEITKRMSEINQEVEEKDWHNEFRNLVRKEQELRKKLSANLEQCQSLINTMVKNWDKHDIICDILGWHDEHIPTNYIDTIKDSIQQSREKEDKNVSVDGLHYEFLQSSPKAADFLELDNNVTAIIDTVIEIYALRAEIKKYLVLKEEILELDKEYHSLMKEI